MTHKRPLRTILLIVGGLFLVLLFACLINDLYWRARIQRGSTTGARPIEAVRAEVEALPPGSTSQGETVFATSGCAACHALDIEEVLVGPPLGAISARAASRQPGYEATEYLYESIVNPGAHVAGGFQGGIMPATYRDKLSEQELADLLAFLLAQ